MSDLHVTYLNDVLSRYDFATNYQVMDEIVLVWKDSFLSKQGTELRERILSFFNLKVKSGSAETETFKEFVQEQDKKKNRQLCQQSSENCLYCFAKQGDWRKRSDTTRPKVGEGT
jgi:hypothetical protein